MVTGTLEINLNIRINYRVDPPQRGVGVNNVTTPMSWPHSDGPLELVAASDTDNATLSEEQCLELHRIISLEKFIPYSKVGFN